MCNIMDQNMHLRDDDIWIVTYLIVEVGAIRIGQNGALLFP